MKEDFITSDHCQKNQSHCKTCKVDQEWRNSIASSFEWDGDCPLGHFKNGVTDRTVKPTIMKQVKFTDSVYCKQGRNCLNCRMSQGVRNAWKKKYEVPDDFDERCPLGKTIEEIKANHKEAIKTPQSTQPALPPLVTMAKNYAKAMTRKFVAKARGEETTVTQEIFEERLRVCRSGVCGQRHVEEKEDGEGGTYEVEQCAACGCGFNKKLWLTTESCPEEYWDATSKKTREK